MRFGKIRKRVLFFFVSIYWAPLLKYRDFFFVWLGRHALVQLDMLETLPTYALLSHTSFCSFLFDVVRAWSLKKNKDNAIVHH